MGKKIIRVLLVDDSEDDTFLTSKALSGYDDRFQIESASSGEECLMKLAEKKYNVLLMDYFLPGMNGLSVLNAVVKGNYDIPIIIVTGQGNEKIAVKSMKKGAYDYIIKSEDYLKVLPVVIQKVIEKFDLDKMRAKLEKDTLDKKSKLEATLNSTSDGIVMVSSRENSKIVSVMNKRFGEIFNIDFDKESEKRVTLASINNRLNKDWDYSKNGEKNFLELYKDSNLEKVDIIENTCENLQVIERCTGPVYETNKEIIGRIWSFRDVTERIELEKKLKKLSITDSLTKLFNQRYFYEVLEKEIERARRQEGSITLILFDIDKFKNYNDTYGHQKGDRAIERVGEIVMTCVRENVDTGYRYGGDEFTVILPDTNIGQAAAVANRIRKSFEKSESGTLSLGLIDFKSHYSLDDLVRGADKAMYIAKKSGGNRLHVYE